MRKTVCILLALICLFGLFSCSKSPPKETFSCTRHTGNQVCSKCGMDYFEALCAYMKTLRYDSEQECYSGTVDDSAHSGSSFEIAYYPKSDKIYLETKETSYGVMISTTLTVSDAKGTYDYRVTRSNGGILAGEIKAASFSSKTTSVSDSYCSFSASEKSTIVRYAAERIHTLVKCFDSVLQESDTYMTAENFGFDSVS